MSKYVLIIILASLFIQTELYAQSDSYIVKPTVFSSGIYNEFSPVYYKGGIVFCSDRKGNSLISYKDDQNRLFNIFYVTRRGSSGWSHPLLLAKEITTAFNDGPVTFNEKGNIMYYSRNNSIENSLRNISDTTNKLGIYSAEQIDGIWTNIRAFTYNNILYSFGTPALTPDGERIYFSSDMPGGMGGMDLYYCDLNENKWSLPVNLGPTINTPKSESFPFASKSGRLFFSSDGRTGFGGKDIYYTWFEKGKWEEPVHLDSSINSPADDFGLVTDSLFEKGYFSTNRRNSDDIFEFSLRAVSFTDCKEVVENNYCFTFWDERKNSVKNDSVFYEWDFGQGIKIIGEEAAHCFPGPGHYVVKLTIRDRLTGDTITNQKEYKVTLDNIEQAELNSIFLCEAHKPIEFQALIKDISSFNVQNYYWDIGQGFKPGRASQLLILDEPGDHIVKLGLTGKADSLTDIIKYCYQKKVRVYNKEDRQVFNNKKGVEDFLDKESKTAYPITRFLSEIYTMKGLTSAQESLIKEHLSETDPYEIKIDRFGISSDSYDFLNSLSEIMISDANILVEILLRDESDKLEDNFKNSELFLQEIKFYMKKQGVQGDNIHLSPFQFSSNIKMDQKEGRISSATVEITFLK